jgi:hypothetical protein
LVTQTFNQSFELHTQKLIDAAIAAKSTTILNGNLSWDQYKFHCGQIRGLEDAKTLLGQALIDLQKG